MRASMSILEKIRNNTARKMLELDQIFAPPPNYTVSEYSEAHRKLSSKDSPESGNWKNWWYQVEMQDVFNDLSVKKCIFMTSTQIGKTAIIFNIIMYIICCLTGGITFMLPTDTYAKDYSKARFTPMLEDCPELAKRIPPGKTQGNTVLFKEWATGFLRFIGSGNADKASSFPSPFICGDESPQYQDC
jgi:phage terminase large subunit GpA-like protein